MAELGQLAVLQVFEDMVQPAVTGAVADAAVLAVHPVPGVVDVAVPGWPPAAWRPAGAVPGPDERGVRGGGSPPGDAVVDQPAQRVVDGVPPGGVLLFGDHLAGDVRDHRAEAGQLAWKVHQPQQRGQRYLDVHHSAPRAGHRARPGLADRRPGLRQLVEPSRPQRRQLLVVGVHRVVAGLRLADQPPELLDHRRRRAARPRLRVLAAEADPADRPTHRHTLSHQQVQEGVGAQLVEGAGVAASFGSPADRGQPLHRRRHPMRRQVMAGQLGQPVHGWSGHHPPPLDLLLGIAADTVRVGGEDQPVQPGP